MHHFFCRIPHYLPISTKKCISYWQERKPLTAFLMFWTSNHDHHIHRKVWHSGQCWCLSTDMSWNICWSHKMKVWNKKCPWVVLIVSNGSSPTEPLIKFLVYSCCRAGRELQLKRTSRSRSTGSQPATRCLFLEVSFHFAHSLFHCIIVQFCCCPECITQNNRYHTIPSNTLQ